MANNSQTARLTQLRALAQIHLAEIETDKAQEQIQLSQAEADIQRYSKMASFDRKRLAGGTKRRSPTPEDRQQHHSSNMQTDGDMGMNKQRFRPFQEILHRLQWDSKFNIDDYAVGYLERFDGIKEMPASSWIRDFSDEEWIPMHRVRYVKRVKSLQHGDEASDIGVVWDRDSRIDKISRSADLEDSNRQPEDLLSVDSASVTGGMPL